MQRYTLSKYGLGCDEFANEQPLLHKLGHAKKELNYKILRCTRCLKMGHSSYSCLAPRRAMKVIKMWAPRGTKVPNTVHMTNQYGPKLAWVPIKSI